MRTQDLQFFKKKYTKSNKIHYNWYNRGPSKICTGCHIDKPISEYYKSKRTKIISKCKRCTKLLLAKRGPMRKRLWANRTEEQKQRDSFKSKIYLFNVKQEIGDAYRQKRRLQYRERRDRLGDSYYIKIRRTPRAKLRAMLDVLTARYGVRLTIADMEWLLLKPCFKYSFNKWLNGLRGSGRSYKNNISLHIIEGHVVFASARNREVIERDAHENQISTNERSDRGELQVSVS